MKVQISIDIIIAKDSETKKLCYKVRYDVFVNETGYIQQKNRDEMDIDEYDSLDTTTHFLAFMNDVPAGTARLLFPNKSVSEEKNNFFGLPMEDLFDISSYSGKNNIGEISRSCVKAQFRKTKIIFYLWKGLVEYASKHNITDLTTSVNPETDKLCDAYRIYNYASTKGLMDKEIEVTPKIPAIGKLKNFRFPLYDSCSSNCHNGLTDFKQTDNLNLPLTLKLFNKVGAVFTGEPVYYQKIDMCAMPMNWKLKDIPKTNFGSLFDVNV